MAGYKQRRNHAKGHCRCELLVGAQGLSDLYELAMTEDPEHAPATPARRHIAVARTRLAWNLYFRRRGIQQLLILIPDLDREVFIKLFFMCVRQHREPLVGHRQRELLELVIKQLLRFSSCLIVSGCRCGSHYYNESYH